MVRSQYDLHYTMAGEAELDSLLEGQEAGVPLGVSRIEPPHKGNTGVIWLRQAGAEGAVRPLVLVSPEEDLQRLFGRYAQVRSDLSPLSPWCYVVTPSFIESVDSLWPEPDLAAAEAAWTGLIVAEALVLAGRPLSGVRIQSCLATQSFAVARAHALWKHVGLSTTLKRFDVANRIFRNTSSRPEQIRGSLSALWECLIALSHGAPAAPGLAPLVRALQDLRDARIHHRGDEAQALAVSLSATLPEAEDLYGLSNLAPEMRLRLFDRLVERLDRTVRDDRSPSNPRRHALALLAGYLATVAAGGAPSLGLIESTTQRLPELTAWAYVVGSVGERIVWTSSFDGLGRLVARELTRPLHMDEPPACDISLDEAAVLADSQLSDPLVRLRVKQARTATVGLFPGVNIVVPIEVGADSSRPEPRPAGTGQQPSTAQGPERLIAAIVDALRPALQREIRDYLRDDRPRSSYGAREEKSNKRKTQNPQLQFPKK